MDFFGSLTRTTMVGVSVVALLSIAAGCASREERQQAADEVSTAYKPSASTSLETTEVPIEGSEKKLICRRIRPTGSRMSERVCMRPEQWEKYAGHARRELDRVQRGALTTNDQGG